MMEKKNRIYFLDVIRSIACSMIILMHSPSPEAGNSGIILVPLSFLTASGIGLFFMVSGALLLPIDLSKNVFKFLKHRMKKIVFPTLFWSLIYITIKYFQKEITLLQVGESLLSIPFSAQGHGIFWFMYTLIGLYLLAPIISSFIIRSTQKELLFYLIVWAITLCYPWLKLLLKIDDSTTGSLYYFTGYSGYFILGYYLHRFHRNIPYLVSIIFIIFPFTCMMTYKALECKGSILDLFWYLSIFVVIMCIGWFGLVQKISIKLEKYSKILTEFSNCSFGIYLMHIIIMRRILWKSDFIIYEFGGIGQIIITWFLTLIICFTCTYIISKLPYSQYIIGYKHKK